MLFCCWTLIADGKARRGKSGTGSDGETMGLNNGTNHWYSGPLAEALKGITKFALGA